MTCASERNRCRRRSSERRSRRSGKAQQEHDRDRREDQVVDDTFDERHPIGRLGQPVDNSRAHAEGQRDQRRRDDGDARDAGAHRHAPQPISGLTGLLLDTSDEPAEVAGGLGESALAEARVDTTLELRHRVPDEAGCQLDGVPGRAGLRHVTTVG